MPKISLVCHVGLLLVLSILAFPRMFGGNVPQAVALGVVALVLAVVMAVTEIFSGQRWVALVVLAAAALGLIVTVRADGIGSLALWAWGIAWAAVVLWFAVLASQARSNR